jgi:hypothetical protein
MLCDSFSPLLSQNLVSLSCYSIVISFEAIFSSYKCFDSVIRGSGLSGPIPAGISLLKNLTDL